MQAAEDTRRAPNAAVTAVNLIAAPATIDVGGFTVDTWAYNESIPGPELRVRAGNVLKVNLVNMLPAATTIHWHGLALRNDMDGVPDLTQRSIAAGGTGAYEFVAPHPGTYWFHPHVGTQLDRGLYAPLIVEDPAETGDYDAEQIIVLDDWLDGTDGRTPDGVLAELQSSAMDMSTMEGSADAPSDSSYPATQLGGDAGDVIYPHFLVNGRVKERPAVIQATPGQRLRLRIINAASDTTFRVAVGGHRLTVTHSDGFPVTPATTDAILIGMGERYDAVLTVADGAYPLVAVAEGKRDYGRAVIRTGTAPVPDAEPLPVELHRAVLTERDLVAADSVLLSDQTPDRSHDLLLGGGMAPYRWDINGRTYADREPLALSAGQRVRLRFVNTTSMYHPMHVHGHTFQIRHPDGPGARKDTVMVMPGAIVTADLIADNPGQWLTHCHNLYHAESGMMTVLSYRR